MTGFIDSTGNVVERARYDGYGKRTLLDASYATITTANVDQSHGYTGIRHDNESGLQYYRARYFDNTLGRFINHDPIGYVDGLNLYSGYFLVNSVDPFGLAIKGKFSSSKQNDDAGYKLIYNITGLDAKKQYAQDGIVSFKITCTAPENTKQTFSLYHKNVDFIVNLSKFEGDEHLADYKGTIKTMIQNSTCCDEGTFVMSQELDFREATIIYDRPDGKTPINFHEFNSESTPGHHTITDQSRTTVVSCSGTSERKVLDNSFDKQSYDAFAKFSRWKGDTLISITHKAKGTFKKGNNGITVKAESKPEEVDYISAEQNK